jgi:hypothetical protein
MLRISRKLSAVRRLRFTVRRVGSAGFLSGAPQGKPACDRTSNTSARYAWTKVRKLKGTRRRLAFTEPNGGC